MNNWLEILKLIGIVGLFLGAVFFASVALIEAVKAPNGKEDKDGFTKL
jgi:hypothetical protein